MGRRFLSSALLFALLAWLSLAPCPARAQPATVQWDDCYSNSNISQKLNISTVYAQVLENDSIGRYLNLTVVGESASGVIGNYNGSQNLATLFTTTEMLTFVTWSNSSFFCETLRPPSPLPDYEPQYFYCPIPAGPYAFTSTIPFKNNDRELTTLDTRLRAVDVYSNEIFCADVYTTILYPDARLDSVYGHARIIFWCTVALTIAYFLVVGLARVVSAWGRGASRSGQGLWSKIENGGLILASAISGERLAKSPALMRYSTPSMRDIIFHTQWAAALSMVAVQWPTFVYPILAQTAWSTLSYNITLAQGKDAQRWNPLSAPAFNPPSPFAEQMNDPNSVLYIDADAPNYVFTLPDDSTDGIVSFAYTVGLRPQDLFGICLALFLAIIAGTIVLSLLVWSIDWFASLLSGTFSRHNGRPSSIPGLPGPSGTRSPRYSSASKDLLDGVNGGALNGTTSPAEEDKSLNSHFLFRAAITKIPTAGKSWWRLRPGLSSFHGSVLHGNLVRILILFHLPVTIFSCYQMSLGRAHASLASVVLAALSFAIFSVILPILLVIRLTFTSTNKLYDETRTLLSFGPLYNHYRHGSQLFACLLFATNLAFGVVIGCGQKSGTAQAIVILVVELVSALGTSVWLPWGHGASMGLISFLFCVARIVVAVFLVILTPTVNIGEAAGEWIAYAVLFIMGLIYLAYALMLFIKLVEAVIRIAGGIGFDRSRHVVDSGLLGACGLLGCCGSRRRSNSRKRHRYRASEIPPQVSQFSLARPPKTTAPSTSTSGPPSVLRPEHALRPYREDSDDESGFIMGSWQPFPRPGGAYSPVDPHSADPSSSHKSSGFARVGGGRAHFDDPYAITSGSTVSFPSVERKATGTPSQFSGSKFEQEESPPPTPSVANQPRHPVNLPPGAMAPHVRTKSQTAIIEHASALTNLSGGASASQPMLGSLSAAAAEEQRAELGFLPTMGHDREETVDDDDASSVTQPKKKHWYNIRKPRRYSEGNPLRFENAQDPGPEPAAAAAAAAATTAAGGEKGRSFVVLRDKKPGSRPGSSGANTSLEQRDSSGSNAPNTSSEPQTPRSFVVMRG